MEMFFQILINSPSWDKSFLISLDIIKLKMFKKENIIQVLVKCYLNSSLLIKTVLMDLENYSYNLLTKFTKKLKTHLSTANYWRMLNNFHKAEAESSKDSKASTQTPFPSLFPLRSSSLELRIRGYQSCSSEEWQRRLERRTRLPWSIALGTFC